jgi:hypothetical protein
MDDYAAGAKRAFGALTESAKVQFGNTASNSYVLPIIASVIGLALIGLVIYVVIQLRSTKPQQTLMGPVDLFKPKSPVVIDRTATKNAMSGTYTLSFYLRVDAVPDMRSDATPLFTWPGIWDLNYNAANEQLQWVVRQTFDGKNGVIEPEKIHLPNVPLQRWTQITMAFEGRTFDLYVNGKLIKSHTLDNMPPSASSSITIVPGGILGQIAYVQLWSRRLTVSDANGNYLDTSDSQGRPFLGPDFLTTLANIQIPNLFCPSGNCTGSQPTANASQKWEFPYA